MFFLRALFLRALFGCRARRESPGPRRRPGESRSIFEPSRLDQTFRSVPTSCASTDRECRSKGLLSWVQGESLRRLAAGAGSLSEGSRSPPDSAGVEESSRGSDELMLRSTARTDSESAIPKMIPKSRMPMTTQRPFLRGPREGKGAGTGSGVELIDESSLPSLKP
jgi:hypothetical protein